jgi:microcystin-dependent protein
MSQPYVGEVRMFGGNFAPAGWMFCQGQLLPIDEYETLFNLIGTTFGGDGQSTFALPDLQSRLPIHQGSGFTLGSNGGQEEVTLTVSQIPNHTHPLAATSDAATTDVPTNNLLAALETAGSELYVPSAGTSSLAPTAVSTSGGSQPHSNIQPYLCVNFIISLFGVFPSQS